MRQKTGLFLGNKFLVSYRIKRVKLKALIKIFRKALGMKVENYWKSNTLIRGKLIK